jgi:chitin disaccharide deacetylase
MKLLLLLSLISAVGQAQPDTTYAERLGFPRGKKVIVLHVDDSGMSGQSNRGTIKALEKGIANSTSVMMPCIWMPEMVNYAKRHPAADVGIHLTLTAEWKNYRWQPLTNIKSAPGLYDAEGAYWHSVAEVEQHASAAEVEAEIRAQIARFRGFGVEPTHLDSHMGTLFQPKFLMAYVKVAMEEHIPALFPGGHATLIGQVNQLSDAQRKLARMVGQQLWSAGLPVFDDLDGSSYGWVPAGAKLSDKELQQQKTAKFIDLLTRARPGLTYIIMHCTDTDPAFALISDSGPTRRGDLLAMLDPALKAWIEKEGIILTTCRELMQRRKNAKP